MISLDCLSTKDITHVGTHPQTFSSMETRYLRIVTPLSGPSNGPAAARGRVRSLHASKALSASSARPTGAHCAAGWTACREISFLASTRSVTSSKHHVLITSSSQDIVAKQQ